ncbi:unnamed protein product [Arabis nemorensis]|uniref:peroxidase n=1 Tax=Arabis nemorensis TaxID=586526 RepID=A0A565C3X7_9BRAS|nr:unnamed protein product [Arabis nemorensis]
MSFLVYLIFLLAVVEAGRNNLHQNSKINIAESKLEVTIKLPANITVPGVITFGDSIVDSGNNNNLRTLLKCNHAPYGQDFPGKIPTGRFTDGRVPSDIVAERLGIAKTIPAYLDPNLKDEDLLKGINFASGGSGYDPLTAKIVQVVSLEQQLKYFVEYKGKLKEILGEEKANFMVKNSLYLVVASSNDLAHTSMPRSLTHNRTIYPEYLADLASKFIRELYGLGARRIGVFSAVPVGCVPAGRTIHGKFKRTCSDKLNQMALQFNTKLSPLLEGLRKELPETKIAFIDVYDTLNDMIVNPKNYVLNLLILITVILAVSLHVDALSPHYYDQTCPQADHIVTNAVKKAMSNDKTVPAALLRMHFHDCFVRGCDGSVLLDSKGKNKAEKDGPPNISLHAFYVIDNAKKALEEQCPGVVSCADIVSLAARDAVALSGGPTWEVPKGRKDGRISKAVETRQLPAPTFNISQLRQSFGQRGLSMHDLVVLSGGHTLGFAHCSSFQNRIHKFNTQKEVDPTLNPSFAASLRGVCPAHNKVKNAGAVMDGSTTSFDNVYYKMLMQGKSLFSSDQALLTSPSTKKLVAKYASSNEEYERAFVTSMIKMSSILGNGNEVRLNCRKVR